MLDPLYWFFCLAAALGTGLCLAFAWKRPWFALGTGLAAATWLLPLPTSDGLPRARAELEAYRHAVASSQPFGDQFEETAEGRTLIFWRWRSWGIDNSIGVIYDPKDALTREFMVFRQRTGGTLYTIKRIAPGYFLVTFS